MAILPDSIGSNSGAGLLPDWLLQALAGAQQQAGVQPYNAVGGPFAQPQGSLNLPSQVTSQAPSPLPPPTPITSAPTPPPQAAMAQAPVSAPAAAAAGPSRFPIPMVGGSDIGGRLGAGLMGFAGSTSPIGAIGNLISGLATGQRSDPVGYQQQIMKATYDAARKAGGSEAEARLIALNPSALTSMENIRHQRATEQQAATTPVKIGTDSFGADIYAVRDPASPSGFKRIDLGAGAGANIPGTTATGLHGEEFLQTVPPERQDFLRKVANYEVDPRTLSIKGGHRERTLAEVAQFRPDYNQQNYAAAQEGLKKFQTGPQGNAIRSFNVAIDHLDQLGELGTALQSGNIQKINEIKNYWRTQTGSDLATNFEGLRAIVGQEVVKAIVSNGGGQAEREEAARRVSAASSPTQLAGIISTYKGAMAAQLQGLKQQYEQSTLRNDFPRLLTPKARAELEKHGGSAAAAAPAAATPGPAAIPPTGERKNGQIYDTPKGPMIWRGNGWEPASNANTL